MVVVLGLLETVAKMEGLSVGMWERCLWKFLQRHPAVFNLYCVFSLHYHIKY
jgi:hypothetical protein